jgi:hypothetical protein
MKAVLEFNYPDDEVKLRRALHAEQAFTALLDMNNSVKYRWKIGEEDEMLEALDHVRNVLDQVLTLCGEKAPV